MASEVLEKLQAIQDELDSGSASREFATTSEWGGADVIIATEMDDRIKRWLDEQPFVISEQEIEPRRRAIITPHAKALSWLFCRVRDAFHGHVDYVTKYDLYALLADAATVDLKQLESDKMQERILRQVLDRAKAYALSQQK